MSEESLSSEMCTHQKVCYRPIEHLGGSKSARWECEACGHAFTPVVPLTADSTPLELADALADAVDSELTMMTGVADVWLGTDIPDEEEAREDNENKKLIIRDAIFHALRERRHTEERDHARQLGRLQVFLYLLMRDKLPTADVAECVLRQVEIEDPSSSEEMISEKVVYSAKGVAEYAGELAKRLIG